MWGIIKVAFDAWYVGFLIKRLDKALKRHEMFLVLYLGKPPRIEQSEKLNGMN